ncbi:MAG: 50S ribosomal protein L16 [Truepera sp.]|nr:50S ribosomal protein L16 [Truepera sp.]MDE0527166.1 50S ribosomal protein L16 [Truepera sp.]
MLLPKRFKYRKQMRGRMKGATKGGDYVAFGDFGLVTLDPGWIRSNQIEACRVAMSRHFRRGGKIYIRIFPDKPITKKPQEVRMGKGKGAVEYWVSVVKPGRILFEVANVTEEQAREAFRLAGHKLPVRTRMVKREVYDEAQ